jgi:N12 class adenine-specific DNA methylase
MSEASGAHAPRPTLPSVLAALAAPGMLSVLDNDLFGVADALRRVMDDARMSPMDRLRLTRELGQIRKDLATATTLQKLKLARRLAEVRTSLGAAIAPKPVEPEPQPEPQPGDAVDFGLKASGIKTRERLNAQVRGIVDKVRDEGRSGASLTTEEREALVQYSGRGGLTDNSQSEYYTPPHVAAGTWDMLAANGFKNGNVLEPSTGAGVFSATKPAGVVISGAEIDPTSSAVAQLLHPEDRITNTSFERYALATADDSFDAVTGNVPFGVRGKEAHHDLAFKSEKRMERYFVRRVLDKVRPGGLVTLIVPTSVIGKKDKTWERWRAEISMLAEFLGGHKLPSKTFGKQGTDVVTDIIVLRKHPRELLDKIDKIPVSTLQKAGVLWPEFLEGRYWQGEGLRFIHGQFVPADPNAARGEDKVIAPADMDDAGLRRKLAAHFDSRIDWAALDAVQVVARAYADGDRKVINGQSMEMRNGAWVTFTPTDPADALLDKALYGVESLAALENLLKTSDGMLSLTAAQAFRAWKKYPHLFNGTQAQAVEFAMGQPADKFRDVAYRGSLLGSLVSKYAIGDDATDRDRVIGLLQAEVVKFGHPSTIGGMVLDGAKAQAFGAYLAAINSAGEVSAAVRGEVSKGKGFESDNILSIVTYLGKQSGEAIDIEAIAALYAGPRSLKALGDIGDVTGIAITAQGEVTTTGAYCCGDVYAKVGELQNAMGAATDERLKAHWTGLIDLMLSKVRHTDLSAIGFGLRDNWIAAKYKTEFLRLNGYDLTFVADKADAFDLGGESEQSEARTGGVWVYRGKDEFRKQLCHYLAGSSIGHNLKDRADSDASERRAEYQEKVQGLEAQFKFFMQSHQDGVDLASTYDMTFNRHVEPDYDQSDLELNGISAGIRMHWYQNAGVRRLSDEGSGILGFDVGLGKAQPLDAKLMTPDGWKRMGDIAIGDTVFAVDGSPVPVVGVFPQGEREIFEVEFSDGSKTRCCDEHLWFTQTEPDRKAQRYSDRIGAGRSYPGSVKSLSEIRTSLLYQTQKNHRIPMAAPIQHAEKAFAVHPYLLGALLGDGGMTHTSITFTKNDPEIAGRLCNLLRDGFGDAVSLVRRERSDRAQTWGISRRDAGGPNVVKDEFVRMGLMGAHSHSKFIPADYLMGSVQQRIELLRGLMDTDGYVSKDGMTVQFTSTSRMLAAGVVEIVQSLGGNAWVTTKTPTYSYKGEKLAGRLAFTVGMRMPPAINPFSLPRKADRVAPKSKYLPVRFIVAVRSVGTEPAQCIAIGHPSHLYVTDDHIVTHNTFAAIAFSVYDRQMGRSKKHCIVVPKSVLANWYMESKKMLGNHDGVLFVGFEPKRNKAGAIVTEPVLDENNQPQRNKLTGQIEYQDVLIEDSPAEVFAKMHSIPAMGSGLVIMTQEKFKTIPLRPETVAAYGDKWVERSMTSAAAAKRLAGKDVREGSYDAKKQEAALQNKFYEEGTKKKDEMPFFEDMGFERVIVDEAHHYKASFQVKEGMDKLAYLPNPAESQRAQDMALKLSHVRDSNGGKGAVLLTATPVANSPIEIYNMLMHVIPPEEMDKLGVYTPADFVRFFGRLESVQKLTVSGTIEDRDGLKGFRNLNILRGLFNRYANMMGPKDVDPEGTVLKLPEAQEVRNQCDMTAEQVSTYVTLRAEAKKSGNPKAVAAGEARPMFAVLRDMDRVTTDLDLFNQEMTFLFKAGEEARVKAMIADLPAVSKRREEDEDTGERVEVDVPKATSYRLAGETLTYVAPDVFEYAIASRLKKFAIGYASHPLTPKYAELVKNLKIELAAKGKQLIFTEEKSQHGKLERLLVENLPEDEARIGIINADTASGEKLQEIVDAYTRGDFTIVICNKKAEVGVNLQRGTTAVHHMTLPWNPASIQQRNGRAVRQGNKETSVRIYYYQAKGSFDEYRLDLLNKKASWIGALLSKDNTDDEHDNENASSDIEQAALLSDNREEFLAKLAAQQALKDAATKDRRDAAAMVGLGQLSAARDFIRTFEARKAKAIAEAQDDLDKAQQALQRTIATPDADPEKQATNLKRREGTVRFLTEKVGRAAAGMDAKKSDAEARMRQVASTLRAQASRGELPFNATLIDTPEEALVTLNRVVVYKGGIYKRPSPEGDDIFRVVGVDKDKRQVDVEYVVKARSGYGAPRDGLCDVEQAIGTHGHEVHIDDAELQLLRLLNERMPYEQLADRVSKDVFLANVGSIKMSGYVLRRRADRSLFVGYDGGGGDTNGDLVYPDRSDKSLLKEVAGLWARVLAGEPSDGFSGGSGPIMTALFGSGWRNAIQEYVKTAGAEAIRTKALEIIRQTVPAVLGTSEAAAAAVTFLRACTGYYSHETAPVIAIKAWATEQGFANVSEVVSGMNSAARMELGNVETAMSELARQAATKAEQERQSASKSDPRFKELTDEQARRFQALGIRAQYNNGDQVLNWPPFSMLSLYDTAGVSGILKRVKDMMKPRFNARWNRDNAPRPYSNTWGVPASTNVDALLTFLED